jgi:putative photosynthetic complex assembly protein
MSDPFADTPFPRGPLIGAAVLLGVALAAVATVRLTGTGVMHVPDAAAVARIDVRFSDRADGGIDVHDARDNRLVAEVAPGTNGFLRGTLRGLARDRKLEHLGRETPFRLTGRADGRLTLEDPATGRRIDLEAFGPTNAGVFARMLSADRGTP